MNGASREAAALYAFGTEPAKQLSRLIRVTITLARTGTRHPYSVR